MNELTTTTDEKVIELSAALGRAHASMALARRHAKKAARSGHPGLRAMGEAILKALA